MPYAICHTMLLSFNHILLLFYCLLTSFSYYIYVFLTGGGAEGATVLGFNAILLLFYCLLIPFFYYYMSFNPTGGGAEGSTSQGRSHPHCGSWRARAIGAPMRAQGGGAFSTAEGQGVCCPAGAGPSGDRP
jgi:hypothetical protein